MKPTGSSGSQVWPLIEVLVSEEHQSAEGPIKKGSLS